MHPTLLIHIGTHKTGTSAIQKFLRENRELMLSKNVVPLSLPSDIDRLVVLEDLNLELISTTADWLWNQIHSMKIASTDDVCHVVSFEGFSGNPLIGYKNSGIVAEHLRRITEGMDVKIIVFLRRQDDFVQSMYTQTIHEGGSLSFVEYLNALPLCPFDYWKFLCAYSQVFGKNNLIVRRYGTNFLPKPYSLIMEFSKIIGVDIEECLGAISGLEFTNSGYTRDSVEIARLCNPFLDGTERWRLRRLLQTWYAKTPQEQYLYWDDGERHAFLQQYEESNRKVAIEYFYPSESLFPDPVASSERNIYQGLKIEAILPILVKAILSEHVQYHEPHTIRLIAKLERKVSGVARKVPCLFRNIKRLLEKAGI